MAKPKITFNMDAWDDLVTEIINNEAVPRMKRVADAANSRLENGDGYLVSTEGDEPLTKRDFRATVITASAEAMRDNAKNNTLINEFHRAGGD